MPEPRRATPAQIARAIGEWERLEISYVKGRHPEFAERYAAEARRNLRRAYDDGERDPQLLAAVGLCEIDAGNPDGAPFFLRLALAQNPRRPRAYYETARMRLADLTRSLGPAGRLSPAETESVVAPLRVALRQRPVLPEALALFSTAWLRSSARPPEPDFALMLEAARNFPARPAVMFSVAVLLARHDETESADRIILHTLAYPVDEPWRTRLLQLHTVLHPKAK